MPGLFSTAAINRLRRTAAGTDPPPRERAGCWGSPWPDTSSSRSPAPHRSDRRRRVHGRGRLAPRADRLPPVPPIRIADISDRDERNALDERYRLAMEAINPMREERWATLHDQARALGAADYVAVVEESTGLIRPRSPTGCPPSSPTPRRCTTPHSAATWPSSRSRAGMRPWLTFPTCCAAEDGTSTSMRAG